MLTSGDVIALDLGLPEGREAGFRRPAVVLTAQRVLDAEPSVVQVAPITTTRRGFHTEVDVDPTVANGLGESSAVQAQHLRSISTARIDGVQGNVGPVVLHQVREIVANLLDLPA
jgi:mRNA interferase MazF